MLVPHPLHIDPRVDWVEELCGEIAWTEIIAYTHQPGTRPTRRYDGRIYAEELPAKCDRLLLYANRSLLRRSLGSLRHPVTPALSATSAPVSTALTPTFSQRIRSLVPQRIKALVPREIKLLVRAAYHFPRRLLRKSYRLIQSAPAAVRHRSVALAMRTRVGCFLIRWRSYRGICRTLYHRCRTLSIPPDVIVCHDLIALMAAVKLKRLFQCPIVYDTHEYWPEADLLAAPWEKTLIARIEARYIRHADRVVTVSSHLARKLERFYGIRDVSCVPNAEPWIATATEFCERAPNTPVQFLIQGRVVPGRAIARFMNAWRLAKPTNAILILRAPDSDYLQELKTRFQQAIDEGLIVLAPAVSERELISEAAQSDVGVITYAGPSLNHLYCCPNKLSQYMHAALAILHHRDAAYVGCVVRESKGGLSFDLDDIEDFRRTIERLSSHEFLSSCRRNAFEYARDSFNWQVQSPPYKRAIQELLVRAS